MSNKKEENKISIFETVVIILLLVFLISKIITLLGYALIPITLIIITTIYCMKIYKKGIYIGLKRQTYKDLETLNRDIDNNYSPAIVSYLYNQQIELKKDLVASLLNLETRGYIKRNFNNQFFIKNMNYSELGKDDLYLYNAIKNNDLQNILGYEWLECVIDEYEKKKFYEKNKLYDTKKQIIDFSKMLLKQVIANIIIFKIINYICIYVNSKNEIAATALIMYTMLYLLAANVLFFIMYCKVKISIYKNKIVLSKSGKEELKKWIKFENFIKKYTLIEEKTAEDMMIYGEFLPYAMVLNLNKDYINEAEKIFGIKKSKELEIILEKEEILNEIFGKI